MCGVPRKKNSVFFCLNKKEDQIQCKQHLSWITFIRYAQNRKIGKPNNFKVFGSNKTRLNNKQYVLLFERGPSWSYGSWIYNYQHNQCLSPLTLWVRIPLRRGELNTTLCDKVCQWLAADQWFSLVTLVSSTNKTDRHIITELFWKVALNIITITFYLKLFP